MKYTITMETDDEFEREAAINSVKNKLLLDGIYDSVFRPIIKYSQDDNKVECYELVWSELKEYLED